jgi:hypothetical protein
LAMASWRLIPSGRRNNTISVIMVTTSILGDGILSEK